MAHQRVSEDRLSLRMPLALKTALEASAERNGRTAGGELRWALGIYLAGGPEDAVAPTSRFPL